MNELTAGMGEIVFGGEGDVLVAQGLGSCVGLLLFDREAKIAGLAHIMLSDSSINRQAPLPRSILLAEADAGVREQLKRIFLNNQFEVIGEAEEKEKALALYRASRPSISLISAFLPPSKGVAVEALLGFDRNANILVLSSVTGKRETLSLLQRGARALLTLPFTEEQVISVAEEVLKSKLLKYADVGFPVLLDTLRSLGAKHLEAMIVGGAYMFPNLQEAGLLNIGKKNVEVVKSLLEQEGIKILYEETGGSVGRTFKFEVSTAGALLKTKDGVRDI
jgi:chemotaxis receptor (MCP) glutamine deamidase CheD